MRNSPHKNYHIKTGENQGKGLETGIVRLAEMVKERLGEKTRIVPLRSDGEVKRPFRKYDYYQEHPEQVWIDLISDECIGLAVDLSSLKAIRLVVVDVEGKHGKSKEARAVLDELLSLLLRYGLNPPVVRTPHDGYHLLFLTKGGELPPEAKFRGILGTEVEFFYESKACYPLISKARQYVWLVDGGEERIHPALFLKNIPFVGKEVIRTVFNHLEALAEDVQKRERKEKWGSLEDGYYVVASEDDWVKLLDHLKVEYEPCANGLKVWCPFHDDGRNPDARVFAGSDGYLFHDFHDDWSGDIVSFYQKFIKKHERRDISRSDACKELMEILGHPLKFGREESSPPKKAEQATKEKETPPTPSSLEACIIQPQGVEVLGYTAAETLSGSSLRLVIAHDGEVHFYSPEHLGKHQLKLLGFEPPAIGTPEHEMLRKCVAQQKGMNAKTISPADVERFYYTQLKEILVKRARQRGYVSMAKAVVPGVQSVGDDIIVVSGSKALVKRKGELFITTEGVINGRVVLYRESLDWVDLELVKEKAMEGPPALKEAWGYVMELLKGFKTDSLELLVASVLIVSVQALLDWRSIVNIIGQKGSGKTTLLRLIEKLYSPLAVYTENITPRAFELLTKRKGLVIFLHDEFPHSRHKEQLMHVLVGTTSGAGAKTYRATASQDIIEAEAPIMPVLAGVHKFDLDAQAASRIVCIRLYRPDPDSHPPSLSESQARKLASIIVGALVGNWERIEAEIVRVKEELKSMSRRQRDNLAPFIAVARLVGEEIDVEKLEIGEETDEMQDILGLIMRLRVPINRDGSQPTVGELLKASLESAEDWELNDKPLQLMGIRVKEDEVAFDPHVIYAVLVRQFPHVRRYYVSDSMVRSVLQDIARACGGNPKAQQVRFPAVSRMARPYCVCIPVRAFLDGGEGI